MAIKVAAVALTLEQKRLLQNVLLARAKQSQEQQDNDVALSEWFALSDAPRRTLVQTWLDETRALLTTAKASVDAQALQRKAKIDSDIAAIDAFPTFA